MTLRGIEKVMRAIQSKLKPCPICNFVAEIFTNDFLNCEIRCSLPTCGCKIQRGTVNSSFADTLKRAEKAWNNRKNIHSG